MYDHYETAGRVLRSGVEALESGEESDPYTKDIEVFVENVFEPVLYEEMNKLEDSPLGDYEFDDERIEEELDYWIERFGKTMGGVTYPSSNLTNFAESLEETYGEKGIETIIAPAVGGVPHGIIAKDMLEAENFGITGYSDRSRDKPRSTAFCTLEESEGNILVPDDSISSGASIIGALDSIDTSESEKIYAVSEAGEKYQVVDQPRVWKAKNRLGLNEENPDRLLSKKRGNVKSESTDFLPPQNMAKKTAIYAGSAGITAAGIEGLINGRPEPFMWGTSALLGLYTGGTEYLFDFMSEEL